MTLSDVIMPVTYEWGINHALIFHASLFTHLTEVQSQYGDTRHVPTPLSLTDGRFMLTADILTECMSGGLFYSWFFHLDDNRFDEIEVAPINNITLLVPIILID